MLKEEFEVNKGTCAIISLGNDRVKIIGNDEKEYSGNVMKAIEYGCNYYGSSFAGRLEGSKFLLGSYYKLPIIMEEESETIFFPTHSYRSDECCWIALGKINDYLRQEYGVKVIFDNEKTLNLPISYDSFETQVFRATKLLLTLKQRKQKSRL